MTSDELAAVSPITGQPDFYAATIEFSPEGLDELLGDSLPFGGRAGSRSGVGRVGGRFSMETFTRLKNRRREPGQDETGGNEQ